MAYHRPLGDVREGPINFMTNSIILKIAPSSTYTNQGYASAQQVQAAPATKPHELYDGVVFVVWALGFLVCCKSIKTLIEIK